MINELGIYYQPGVATARVQVASRRLISSLVLGVVIAVFEIALILGFLPGVSTAGWMIAVVFCIMAVPVILRFLTWRRALKDREGAEAGLAIGINREGMMVRGLWFTWPEIRKAWLKPGRWSGPIHLLITTRAGQELMVPLSYTDTMPASLDTAIRTLSDGQVNVDISHLDS